MAIHSPPLYGPASSLCVHPRPLQSDNDEVANARIKLAETQDEYLEAAAAEGFKVTCQSTVGRRFMRWLKDLDSRQKEYDDKSPSERKKMVSNWAKGEYEQYKDCVVWSI